MFTKGECKHKLILTYAGGRNECVDCSAVGIHTEQGKYLNTDAFLDMYEACKLAVKLADAIVKQVNGDNIEVLMARATINEAIKKAEGEL